MDGNGNPVDLTVIDDDDHDDGASEDESDGDDDPEMIEAPDAAPVGEEKADPEADEDS